MVATPASCFRDVSYQSRSHRPTGNPYSGLRPSGSTASLPKDLTCGRRMLNCMRTGDPQGGSRRRTSQDSKSDGYKLTAFSYGA